MDNGDPICVMARFAGIVGAKRDDVIQAQLVVVPSEARGSIVTRYPYGYARFDGGNSCTLADGAEGISWCFGTLGSPAMRAMVVAAWALVR